MGKQTYGHSIARHSLDVFKHFIRRQEINKQLANERVKPAPDLTRPRCTQVESTGLDYSTSALYDTTGFPDIASRFDHFDEYFGTPMLQKFHSTTGHMHTGEDGDGPLVPAINIVLPEDAIGGFENFDEHMCDPGVHGLASSIEAHTFYDDFERGGLSTQWDTVAGSPSIAAKETGGNCLELPEGSAVRINSGPHTWNDRFTLEFDAKISQLSAIQTLEAHLRESDAEDDTHLVFRISSSDDSGIWERIDSTSGEIQISDSLYTLPVSDSYRHYRIAIYGSHVALHLDLDGSAMYLVGSTPNTSGSINGYIEFSALGDVWLDNVHISRNRRLDISDFTDYAGVLAGNWVAPEFRHAYKHFEDGEDELDIGDLADRDDRLLTVEEKELLVPGGYLHHHTDDGIYLNKISASSVLGRHTTAYEHVRDADLHVQDTSGELLHPPPIFVPQSTTDEGIGTYGSVARVDHFHVQPYWYWLWTTSKDIDYLDHFCPTDSCIVRGATGDTNWGESIVPTICGEISSNIASLANAIPGINTWGYHMCYYIRLYNSGAACTRRLLVPGVFCNMKIYHKHSRDTVLLLQKYSGILFATDSHEVHEDDTFFFVDMTLESGWNDLYVYCYFTPDAKHWVIQLIPYNDAGTCPNSLFSYTENIHFVPMPLRGDPTEWWSVFPDSWEIPG